ncbi:hypothetical protein LEY_24 [Paenibacillus phage Ley]|uniref:DUF4352 domain-containing protein n=3 Tax=Halcyonevirus C7Cdelta TaxID=2845733 RepID=A0A345ASI1_9CAUD|nr:hypothetical protein KMD17_gp24 [Paenibacillus phage C7Cdelta]AXF39785.1 hypothetical protein C7CDELTA_24 [Paenibacillus phage C7Cdelta]AXF39951.1 hypothetical protein ASH_24 [Paenibacillus phage Ash]AXF40238.1 hypothetical protein LEY_24 [Paenibacillus phage Ley]
MILGVWLGSKGDKEIKDTDYIAQNGPHSRVYKKGESVNLNKTYGITVHSVKKTKPSVLFHEFGEDFDIGKDNKLVEVKLTVKNFSNKDIHVYTIDFEIMESKETFRYASSASGGLEQSKIKPKESVNGSLFFKVPKDVHSYTLVFSPDLGSNVVKFKL